MNDIYPIFKSDEDPVRHQRKSFLSGCFYHAIAACDPYQAVKRNLQLNGNTLFTSNSTFELEPGSRVHLCALGKAAIPMAQAVVDALGDLFAGGIVVTKSIPPEERFDGRLKVMAGDHPLPGTLSLQAGKALIAYCQNVMDPDILIFLISGGGSSLAVLPADDLSLEDLRQLNGALLRSRIAIEGVNVVRRHLDLVKNGGLLSASATTRNLTLILSDVINGEACSVASGPTIAEGSTFSDCIHVLSDASIMPLIPVKIRAYLEAGKTREDVEIARSVTQKTGHPFCVIGDNHKAVTAITKFAEENGYSVFLSQEPLSGSLESEAERIINDLDGTVVDNMQLPLLMVWGGEVTVKRKGNEPGGRNTHLSLLLAEKIARKTGIYGAALATDGEDGTSPAAGAYFDHTTLERAKSLGISARAAMEQFASFRFFSALGDIACSGSTGTNVNDIVIMIKEPDL